MLNDNLVGDAYSAERINANSPTLRAMEDRRLRKEQEQSQEVQQVDDKAVAEKEVIPEVTPEEAPTTDQEDPSIWDNISEMPTQALAGFLDATKEAGKALESVFPLGTLEGGELTDESPTDIAPGKTLTGNLTRSMSQFLTGFIPGLKATKAIGIKNAVGGAMAAGAAADAFVFDPQDERLSNLIEQYPTLSGPVTEYLAANPDDSDAEGRFKSALEGLIAGGIIDSTVKVFKVLQKGRAANKQKLINKRENIQVQKEVDKELASEVESPTAKVEERLGGEDELITLDTVPGSQVDDITGERISDGDTAININMNRIDSDEDIKNIITKTAENFTPEIHKARRGKISLEETEKLADDLGMSVQELMKRNAGEAFNAEKAVAARKILISSGNKVVELAKQSQLTGGPEDKFALMKAVTIHRAIQEQVSGLTAEAGRALSSFRIQAKAAKDQQKAIEDLINSSGGRMDDKTIDILAMADNPRAMNEIVDKLAKPGLGDVLLENFYNSLLSAPPTHIVNVIGNASNMLWNATSRFVTPVVGKAFGDQETSFGEAGSALYGMMAGMKDGLRFAGMAIKSSDFVLENGGTMELARVHAKRAISKETFNLSGVPGKAVDWLGSIIRTPGRALTAGDAFFRSANQRMELQALAHRTAIDEGLSGDALGRRIVDIVNNPSDDIMKQAKHFSTVQTFTNDLGKGGKHFQQAVNSFRPLKLVVPFIRTPVNIIKTVGVNSPLAPLSKNVRTEIMAGGARRDKAVAQIAMGSSTMAMFASLEGEGFVTGAGPSDPDLLKTMKLSGWQPFSFKIGDSYYPYSRVDPVGMFIGFGASFSEIVGRADQTDSESLASELVLSTYSQVANKTFIKGLTDVISAVDRARRENSAKPLARWFHNTAAAVVVPLSSGVAAIERGVDPTFRQTEGFIDRIRSRTPGLSKDIPPVINVFGETVFANGGLGENIMSPIYRTIEVKDPVIDELVRMQVPMGMPNKSIDGIRLTTKEYHDYTKLAGKVTEINGKNYHDFLGWAMKQNSYVQGTDTRRTEIIKQITFDFRGLAREQFKQLNAEFGLAVKQNEAEKAVQLRAIRDAQ